MKLFRSLEEISAHFSGVDIALTVGNFDGVHKGHKALLEDLKHVSASYDLKSVVMTFDPHPRAILQPQLPFSGRLFPVEDLIEQMQDLAVDGLWIERFSKEFSELSAENFIEHFFKPLNIKYLLIGHDFRFGRGRSGSIDQLLSWCQKRGVQLKVFNPYFLDEERVSTSLIREYLFQGKPEEAAKLLGRPYVIKGHVKPGHNRGEGMGFPTANLNISAPLCNGVYITEAEVNGKRYPSVTNVGLRPTVNEQQDFNNRNIETYILDQSMGLYDLDLSVHFYKYIRPEIKFETLKSLSQQIKSDVEQAKKYFGLG